MQECGPGQQRQVLSVSSDSVVIDISLHDIRSGTGTLSSRFRVGQTELATGNRMKLCRSGKKVNQPLNSEMSSLTDPSYSRALTALRSACSKTMSHFCVKNALDMRHSSLCLTKESTKLAL